MSCAVDILSRNNTLITDVGNNCALIIHVKQAICIRSVTDCTVRGLNKELCLSVLVHIVEHELVPMGA